MSIIKANTKYSSDNINTFDAWNKLNISEDVLEATLYYYNNTWIARREHLIMKSTNGIDWEKVCDNYSGDISGDIVTIAYGNGTWMLVTADDIYYSTDLVNWTAIGIITTKYTQYAFTYIECVNDVWFASGGVYGTYYSYDGLFWRKINNSAICLTKIIYNGTYYLGIDKGVYGKFYYGTVNDWYLFDSTISGISDISELSLISLVFFNNCYILATNQGIYYSGIIWKQSNISDISDIGSIAGFYCNEDVCVTYVLNSGIYYSTDGINWEQCYKTSKSLTSTYVNNGVWLAWNANDGFELGIYSTDGINWTKINFLYDKVVTVKQISYANGVWVASTNKGLYYYQANEIPKIIINYV